MISQDFSFHWSKWIMSSYLLHYQSGLVISMVCCIIKGKSFHQPTITKIAMSQFYSKEPVQLTLTWILSVPWFIPLLDVWYLLFFNIKNHFFFIKEKTRYTSWVQQSYIFFPYCHICNRKRDTEIPKLEFKTLRALGFISVISNNNSSSSTSSKIRSIYQ